MNKNQLFIMWIGVILFLFVLFDPLSELNGYKQTNFLIAIPLITGGLIITLKGKDKKTLPFFKWMEDAWKQFARSSPDNTKHKKRKEDKEQRD